MLSILQMEFSKCQYCNKPFSDKRKPHTLTCGRTLCDSCLKEKIIPEMPCGFDRKHKHKDIEAEAPVNLVLLDAINLLNELCEAKEKNNSTFGLICDKSKSKSRSNILNEEEKRKLDIFITRRKK